MPGKIGQEHTILRLQQRRSRLPKEVIDRCGMQEDHTRPAAAILIVQEIAHRSKLNFLCTRPPAPLVARREGRSAQSGRFRCGHLPFTPAGLPAEDSSRPSATSTAPPALLPTARCKEAG